MTVCFAVLLLFPQAQETSESLVGQRVMVVQRTESKSSKRVVGSLEFGDLFTVGKVQKNWLLMADRSAWVSRKATVPVKDAISLLSADIQANPDSRAYERRSRAYLALRELDKAQQDIEQAISLEADRGTAYLVRGQLNIKAGNHGLAVSDLTRAIEHAENAAAKAQAFAARADAKLHQGKQQAAMEDIAKALQENSRCAEAFRIRGDIKRADGNLSEAIADYGSSARYKPHDVLIYYRRGSCHDLRKKHLAALKDYDKAVAMFPNSGFPYFCRGISHSDAGDHSKADTDFARVIQLDPSDVKAMNNRAFTLTRLGKMAEAIQMYDSVLKLNSTHGRATRNRADLLMDLKRYKEAIAAYGQVLKLDPKYIPAYLDRGRCHEMQGAYAKALLDYDRAIRLAPRDADAHNRLAWLRATCKEDRIRNPAIAIRHGRIAVLLTKEKDADKLHTLATGFAGISDWRNARRLIQQAILLDPKYAKETGRRTLKQFEQWENDDRRQGR